MPGAGKITTAAATCAANNAGAMAAGTGAEALHDQREGDDQAGAAERGLVAEELRGIARFLFGERAEITDEQEREETRFDRSEESGEPVGPCDRRSLSSEPAPPVHIPPAQDHGRDRQEEQPMFFLALCPMARRISGAAARCHSLKARNANASPGKISAR